MGIKEQIIARLHESIRPTITDPFTQVLKCEYREVYQGPHTFVGYEHPKPPKKVWKIVPITNFDHYFQGLDNIIYMIQKNNITTVRSPFATQNSTRFVIKNQEKYLDDLNQAMTKYSGLHQDLMIKFTENQQHRIQTKIQTAIQNPGTGSI
jgi:hypothetical protein